MENIIKILGKPQKGEQYFGFKKVDGYWVVSFDEVSTLDREIAKNIAKELNQMFIDACDGYVHQDNEVKCNKHVVSGSCVSCHYSGNGAHGCNRLMDGVTPKIDKSKGVECAYNGYVHYLPFSHDR